MTDRWTTLKLLAWTQDFFAKKDVDAPRLTAEVLLAHALSCDRVRLYLDFDKPLGDPELARFRELVPRPETELLVEAALAALPEGGSALDLCTGSGCVAVSLALPRKGARVLATDVSEEALALARENAVALGAVVEFATGDLWAAVHAGELFDVVVSNPPYVPTGELAGLSREVRREPCIALDGGEDGLAVLRRIVLGAASRVKPGGTLCLEMHESHVEALPALCRGAGFARAEARPDLAGLPRLVVATVAGGVD